MRLAQRPDAVRFEELEERERGSNAADSGVFQTSGLDASPRAGSHDVYKRGGERFVVPRRRPHP